MQQNNFFFGHVSKEPVMSGTVDKPILKINIMTNEYVGKDKEDRIVSLQFTAFGNKAKALSKVNVGDQLGVKWRIENNNYDKNGETQYSFNFIIEDMLFGRTKIRNSENQ